jgi:hypothetical protein
MPKKKKPSLCQKAERKKRRRSSTNRLSCRPEVASTSRGPESADEVVLHPNSCPTAVEDATLERRSRNAESHRRCRQAKVGPERLEQHRIEVESSRTRVRSRNLTFTQGSARNPITDETHVPEDYRGRMTDICEFCGSINFKHERPSDGKYTYCCQKGKVHLPPIHETPPFIKNLLTGNHSKSRNFMDNIRAFNSAFGFASMGANIASPPGHGPYCFRIHGQIYHRTGTLHPTSEETRMYSQVYILDAEEATNCRLSRNENSSCDPELMKDLGDLMNQISPFAKAYKMLHEVEMEAIQESVSEDQCSKTILMAIRQDRNSDPRRYNNPRVNEVAIIFQNADGEPPLERDLLIHLRPATTEPAVPRVQRINILDPNLEPMIYSLMLPYGDQGWSTTLPLQGSGVRSRVTQMQYYGYRLAVREAFNPFLNYGKLTQQFIVDAYVKAEANRLNYIRTNQNKLRVELYSGLLDHINSSAEEKGFLPGKPIILPSSFQGSPRNMQQNYQDAMAIVRKYGKPDLFITMTCNPSWKEIVENLSPWQRVENRPDLVARVFHMKLKELLEDVTKSEVFGKPVAKIHVIEFQKRGLPHAHMLLILAPSDKPRTKEAIDDLVKAEIPEKTSHPRLNEIVLKHMIHGPCGLQNQNSPCMINGECSKGFPKPFQEETNENVDGYPRYRRRKSLKQHHVRNLLVDNQWVVPYNPYLSLKYNCHINVEVCASIKSVKYLFKYVYKGHDCADIEIVEAGPLEHNEIKQHMDSR